MDVLTEARFWMQVVGDSKRTVVCPPDLESRVKGWIDARDMSGIYKVIVNPACPPEKVFVIDEQGIEAGLRQQMQRPIRFQR